MVGQFEGVNARDFAAVMDAYADDVTLVLHGVWVGQAVEGDTVVGKTAVGDWFGDWFGQFASDYRFEIEESRSRGERVFLVATHSARGRHSGVPVQQRLAYVYTVRESRVSRVELWEDREAALQAFESPGAPPAG